MKTTIIRSGHLFIAFLMILLTGVGASASAPWSVNPADYRYDMTLYLSLSFPEAEMDYSLYDVAAFCGDECRGIAEVLPLSSDASCLYLRVRSNRESGETMTFKYCEKESGKISPVDEASFTFEADSRLGYPSSPYKVEIPIYFDIIVTAGEGGSVSSEGGRYKWGSELSLEAIPDEGYSFLRWSTGVKDNPLVISVEKDMEISAEFALRDYTLKYLLDDELYLEKSVYFKTPLTPEADPVKEGHTFSGWSEIPETMPAHDVTVTGSFSINSYNAVFKIGDEVIETVTVEFGKPITVPEAPEKEGYTFNGWSDIPETMPANDIEITGSYTVNKYILSYLLDGEKYSERSVDFGTEITPEANPTKEGYTFSGWSEIPETMPAHDVTVTGSFSINSYNAIFKIGDEVIETVTVEFGKPITVPEAPEKEGYTFNGWSEIPETMPAHDVTVTGSFSINSYLLRIYLNGEIYSEEEVEFGSELMIEDPDIPEGNKFEGWLEEIPLTMPAYDLEIHGTYSPLTSVASILEESNGIVTVYTITGRIVCKDGKWNEISSKLKNGIYIVNGHKIAIYK